MVFDAKRSGALVLRLMVGLALLGCARMGNTQGTWSVIAAPGSAPGTAQLDGFTGSGTNG